MALEEEVARGVAAGDQLRKDDQLGPTGHEVPVGIHDAPAVAGEVADGGIDLSKPKAHAFKCKGSPWTQKGFLSTYSAT